MSILFNTAKRYEARDSDKNDVDQSGMLYKEILKEKRSMEVAGLTCGRLTKALYENSLDEDELIALVDATIEPLVYARTVVKMAEAKLKTLTEKNISCVKAETPKTSISTPALAQEHSVSPVEKVMAADPDSVITIRPGSTPSLSLLFGAGNRSGSAFSPISKCVKIC